MECRVGRLDCDLARLMIEEQNRRMKPDIIDTIEETGVHNIKDVEYTGNFTVKYYSKEDLVLLQKFFGVRRMKFDMKLLDKRPELKQELEDYNYEKSPNNRDSKDRNDNKHCSCEECDCITEESYW